VKKKDKNYSIGKRIKSRIQELKTTQPKVAQEADISKGALHNIKDGKKKPSVRVLARIANALKTSISKLINQRGDNNDKGRN